MNRNQQHVQAIAANYRKHRSAATNHIDSHNDEEIMEDTMSESANNKFSHKNGSVMNLI